MKPATVSRCLQFMQFGLFFIEYVDGGCVVLVEFVAFYPKAMFVTYDISKRKIFRFLFILFIIIEIFIMLIFVEVN